MQKQARSITTNQIGIHPNLEKVVSRHLGSVNQKPFSEHTKVAFEETLQWLDGWQGPLILDSCCGVGESTANIAKQHPDAKVIGVDKSALRVDKHQSYAADVNNYIVVRADLNDFLRLIILENIKLDKHYLLYPNPYPKSAHLQRRWYATSTLADILKLGGKLEVRSNWKLYIQEFSEALKLANFSSQIDVIPKDNPMTPFERKYQNSGQDCWQLTAKLLSETEV